MPDATAMHMRKQDFDEWNIKGKSMQWGILPTLVFFSFLQVKWLFQIFRYNSVYLNIII